MDKWKNGLTPIDMHRRSSGEKQLKEETKKLKN